MMMVFHNDDDGQSLWLVLSTHSPPESLALYCLVSPCCSAGIVRNYSGSSSEELESWVGLHDGHDEHSTSLRCYNPGLIGGIVRMAPPHLVTGNWCVYHWYTLVLLLSVCSFTHSGDTVSTQNIVHPLSLLCSHLSSWQM